MKLSLRLAVACSLIALAAKPAPAVLVAAWNFNDNSPITDLLTRTAGVNSVNGTMTASSTFTSFAGNTTNAVSGDAAGQAFAYQGAPGGSGSSISNNGASVLFSFNLLGYAAPVMTFSTIRSGTGFNSNTVAYSINGGSFVDFGTYDPTTSITLQTFDFSSVAGVNDSNFRVRITFNGATNVAGSSRIDNVQLNAIPEPTAGLFGLMLANFLGLTVARRPAQAV